MVKKVDMVVEVEHPRVGKLKVTGTPMKFSRTHCRIEKACPDIGEHAGEILSSLLGISPAEFAELRMEKVI
jgi:formyl-CoA transferase